jgi:putative PIN family toxin of toxin-antitoxin system
MARIVIDANVVVSAAFGGKPLEALVLAFKDHDVFVSETVIRELNQTVLKLSGKLSPEQRVFIEARIQQIMAMATCLDVSTPITLSRDPGDDHYLSLCKESNADFLITGDKDLLSISQNDLEKYGISTQILTPTLFLTTTN